MEGRSTTIPNFVKAGSPLGLRRQMLLVSAKLGMQIGFFDIQYVNDGKEKYWIAWYYKEMTNDDALLNGKAGE